MRHVTRDTYFAEWDRQRQPYHDTYCAMYHSGMDAVLTDPCLMQIPLDDHMVHRGDAVFEMCKCVQRGIYNLDAHLARLRAACQTLGIALPVAADRFPEIVCETVRVAACDDAAIRIYVSRGPGSFGVNPYDCPLSRLYIVVTRLSPSFMELHPQGARVGYSAMPLKDPKFATMKSCNYLPNVLMKKEAIDHGWDFALAFDAEGFLAEGPTENIGIVTEEGALLFPEPDRVLRGTTMERVLALAQPLVAEGMLTDAGYGRISRSQLEAAREVLVTGTTTDVTHVAWLEGRALPEPGPVTTELHARLLDEIRHDPDLRTDLDGRNC